jgi:hypothetical protein
MTDATIDAAGGETRLAMLRVWMAISAVWVAFWLSLAGIVVLTGAISNSFVAEFGLLTLIVVTPPVALLAIGIVIRLIFETVSARFRND